MPKTAYITVFQCAGLVASAKIQTVSDRKYWLLKKNLSRGSGNATWEQVSEYYDLKTAIAHAIRITTEYVFNA